MAGVEKRCEYSGKYIGWPMYSYRRNHIQICPEYRKLFRGAKARLELRKDREEGVWYTLVVKDDHLRGVVDGRYMNHTTQLDQVIRRLKRMLRCRTLRKVMKETHTW